MNLKDFFPDIAGNPTQTEHSKTISERYPAFTAKPISECENASIRRATTHPVSFKNMQVMQQDANEYTLALVLACVTYPDFKNADLQSAWGVQGAETLIQTMLLPGEFAVLADWISEICGFDIPINDFVDQAKN